MRLARCRIAGCATGTLSLLAPAVGYCEIEAIPRLLTSQTANPVPLAWSFAAGVEHSDNISRTPEPRSDTVARADVSLDVHHDHPRLKVDFSLEGEYRDYLEHTYGNSLVGAAAGSAVYSFIPDRFKWVAADNFGQIADNSLQAQTPGNRRFINRAETGPDLAIPLSARNRLLLQGRIVKLSLQDSTNGNRQISGTASLAHSLSEVSSLSVNYSQVHVVYDSGSLYAPYTINETFLRWVEAGVRTALTLDVGYSQLKAAGTKYSGTVARLGLERMVGALSIIQVEAGTHFSNAGDNLQLEQNFAGLTVNTTGVTTANDPERSKYALASWSTRGSRNAVNVAATWTEELHQISTFFNRTRESLSSELTRSLTPRTSGSIEALYTRNKYQNAQLTTAEWQVRGGLTWRLKPALSWTMSAGHYQGNGFLGRTQTYRENRVYTGLTWLGQQ